MWLTNVLEVLGKVLKPVSKLFGKSYRFLRDFVTDKNDDGDEKRFFGICFLVYGLVFSWNHPEASTTAAEVFATGVLLLSAAVVGDKVSPTLITTKEP